MKMIKGTSKLLKPQQKDQMKLKTESIQNLQSYWVN